jgi:hypothetical protein
MSVVLKITLVPAAACMTQYTANASHGAKGTHATPARNVLTCFEQGWKGTGMFA